MDRLEPVVLLLAVEELLDLRRRFRLDIEHGTVKRGQGQLRLDGLTGMVFDLDQQVAAFAGLVLRLVSLDLDIEEVTLGRDGQAAGDLVHLAVADHGGLDVEVRLVPPLNGDIDDDGTIRQAEKLILLHHAAKRVRAEDHIGIRLGHIDQNVSHLTGGVIPLVRKNLEVVKAIELAVKLIAGDPEDRIALHLTAPRILGAERNPELAGTFETDRQLGLAVRAGFDIKGLIDGLDDLVVAAALILDLRDRQLALGRDRSVIRGRGLDGKGDLVTRPQPAAVRGDIGIEGLACGADAARAADGAAGAVGHLGLNEISVIGVAVVLGRVRGLDLYLQLSVTVDLGLTMGDKLSGRGQAVVLVPRRRNAAAAPALPPGEPFLRIVDDPVARAVQPVVPADRHVVVCEALAEDFVFHRAFVDGRAEIVLRLDDGRDRLAELGVVFAGLYGYLEFRLLVFLDAEIGIPIPTPAAPFLGPNLDAIRTQRRLLAQGKLAFGRSILVGRPVMRGHLDVLRIVDFHVQREPGGINVRTVRLLPNPGFEAHRVVRPIDRAIRDGEDARVVVALPDRVLRVPVAHLSKSKTRLGRIRCGAGRRQMGDRKEAARTVPYRRQG